MKKLAILVLLAICGCSTMQQRDISTVPQTISDSALKVRVFTVENSSYPKNYEVLGEVKASSFQRSMLDPQSSKGDALKRLQIEAAEKGANGIINVTFDTRGTDLGANVWESVQASGLAVRFK